LDIAVVHRISHTEVYRSVWKVVDAVNKCPDLSFSFPHNYNEQEQIAKGFMERSVTQFDCCIGCIDGMLLWIEQPSKRDCFLAKVKPKKFYCGQKKWAYRVLHAWFNMD
jgi:hypothetical protein